MRNAANDTELEKLFFQQKECFIQQLYPDYASRIRVLTTLRKLIIDNQELIVKSVNQDFGCRPEFETQVLEIFPCLQSIDYAIKNLKKWLKPRRHSTSIWFWPSKCFVKAQPKGVVGIISPWNYPLLLTIAPLVSALAAGNRVMLKLSEHTPKTSELLVNLFTENFMPSKVIALTGDASVGTEFSKLDFDHLFFTGATAVGKKVMLAASEKLTPVTLELGGKSPVIILEDEMKQHYINRVWAGKIINSGQTCIAPDYLWLPRGDADKLLELSKKAIENKFKLLSIDKDYCSIINKQNYNRILELIKEAESKGGKWQPLIKFSNGSWHCSENNIYKIAPGLIINADHTMQIMQEEIFGPVLPVMEYDTVDQLLISLKITPRPLAMYLFTHNKKVINKFISNTISGALSVNNTVIYAAQESLPFGGVGDSGIGEYRGQYGFDTFSILKPVFKQSKFDLFSKFYPPKKSWQVKLLNFMLK